MTVQCVSLDEWMTGAMRTIREELRGDPRWSEVFSANDAPLAGVHLAVLVEPFLTYVLDGRKSVESRFSTRQCAPFQRVSPGDLVLLKAASGPVMGICRVSNTWFFDLASVSLSNVRDRFATAICATDDDFWQARKRAEYATLLKLAVVRPLEPMTCPKRDRRGWVILRGRQEQLRLPGAA